MGITNCINCGAVMEYSKQYYGSMYKCPYCKTEHHIDLLGRIEEYKVKFTFQGRLIEAYLNSYTVEFTPLCESYRTIDGSLDRVAVRNLQTLDFNFTGYVIEDLKKDEQ